MKMKNAINHLDKLIFFVWLVLVKNQLEAYKFYAARNGRKITNIPVIFYFFMYVCVLFLSTIGIPTSDIQDKCE